MAIEHPKKVRLVAVVEGPDPAGAHKAGVVSGVLSYAAAGCVGATRELALEALRDRLAGLGYDAEIAVHDTLESAEADVRRRRAADELLRAVTPPYPERVAELLPDRPDAVEALRTLVGALSSAARGTEDTERPPIEDGHLVCPDCADARPEYGFEATADALITVRLNARGETTDTGGVEIQIDPRGYRDVSCRWCGAELGDLSPDAVYSLANFGGTTS